MMSESDFYDFVGLISLVLVTYCIYLLFKGKKAYKNNKSPRQNNKSLNTSLAQIAAGKESEKKLFDLIVKSLGSEASCVFRNVNIPYAGGTIEIDVIAICHEGVFCFENKYWSGNVYGHDGDGKWVAYSEDGTKNYFYSPINQNFTHRDCLAKQLDLEPREINCAVVFDSRSHINTENFTSMPVLHQYEVAKWMKETRASSSKYFANEALESTKRVILYALTRGK